MQWYALIGNVLIDKSYTAYSKVTKLVKEEIYNVKVNRSTQKWLNMALKYLWLLGDLPNDIKEELLHAPIDSYILQKLWNLNEEGVTCSADTFYYKGNSWSKISDYDDYFDLQKVIRDMAKQGGKTVIEQENEAWI